jgi:multicomponent Na+:H+ antiporter subunit D
VSLILLFGLMTLIPAVVAIIFGLVARFATFHVPSLVALIVAALAAAVPIAGLILLASDLIFPTPLRFAFAGDSDAPFAPLFRADGLSYYGAWGIAAIITPLLLWLVWMDAGRAEDSAGRFVAELGLVIGIEAAALHLVFADNLLWLGLAWLVLVGLVWLLGEQGTETSDLDYLGLAAMVVGPVLTVVVLLLVAITSADHTLYTMAGHSVTSLPQVVLLAIALAAAGGGYPFVAWVRRRAAFTTPSGFAALAVLALPAVVFVGARAWGALQTIDGLWPQLGAVTPPITAGIALAILGVLSVAISGLLALSRRDGRTLIALLATAQVGWALFALGSSQPEAAIGTIVLLATGVLGLGAMTASLVAGGVLTADNEPDAAGPVPLGIAPRPLNLFAWSVGAATALGVPFFGGFIARHLMTAGTLTGTKLGIPLLGLAWLGDVLFALALIRATVPAFKADPESVGDEIVESDETDETDETVATEEAVETSVLHRRRASELHELPGAVLALLGVALGVFPQTFLAFGALFAADQITPESAVDRVLTIVPFGYRTTNSQWLPVIFWLVALALGVVVALMRLGAHRTMVTLETVDTTAVEATDVGAIAAMDALDEPAVVWVDLAPAFASPWTQVAGKRLIGGIDDEDDDFAEDVSDEEDNDGDTDDDLGDESPPDSPDDGAVVAPEAVDAPDAPDAPEVTEAAEASTAERKSTKQATKQTTRKSGQRGPAQK